MHISFRPSACRARKATFRFAFVSTEHNESLYTIWTSLELAAHKMKPRGNRARLKLHCNYAASEIIRCQVCRTTQELAERLPRVSFLSAVAARLLSSSRIDSEFCLIHAAAACFTPWALFYIYTLLCSSCWFCWWCACRCSPFWFNALFTLVLCWYAAGLNDLQRNGHGLILNCHPISVIFVINSHSWTVANWSVKMRP